MTPPLHEITVAEAGRRFRAKSLSPVELTQAYLERIEAIDPFLNAFIEVTADRALAEAKQAQDALSSGRDLGPMQGIPYGLKDIYETAGLRTTAHSRLLADHVPARDCTVQAKLRAGGGVLLGKQSTWEFALGGPSFDLPWPPARNPWDLGRSPLGSSSGAGASIAAGLCPAATGSDTGGSIRMPAAACGIAGLKPTYGLVSRRGVLPNSYSYDHCGPMAWTSEDCALMLGVMAGHDPGDPGSLDVPPSDYAAALGQSVKGLRIGVIRDWYETEARAEPAVIAAMDEALRVFACLGCRVSDATLPSLRTFSDAKTPITLSELYALHEGDLKTRPELFGRSLRYRVLAGALVRAEDYIQALRWRAELTAETLAVLADVDLLVTAGALTAAPPLEPDEPPTFLGATVPSITAPFNTTGLPTLALPSGYDAAGMPVGMQIAGRPLDEGRVLALGHAYEIATRGARRRPDLSGVARAEIDGRRRVAAQ